MKKDIKPFLFFSIIASLLVGHLANRTALIFEGLTGNLVENINAAIDAIIPALQNNPFMIGTSKTALISGAIGAACVWLIFLYNVFGAKNFMRGSEHGSARWGTAKDGAGGGSSFGAEIVFRVMFKMVLCKVAVDSSLLFMQAIYSVAQEVVTGIAGVVANGSVSGAVDLAAMTAQINAMSLGDQIGMLLELVIVKFGVWVLLGLVQIICIARFIEIYVYIAISPIPIATFPSDDLNQIAKGFLKSFAAVCLQGAFIYLILSFFPILVSSNILGDTSAWGLLLYSLILALGVFSSSRWAKSVCNAM